MKSYVEYWREKQESARIWNAALRVHTIAMWDCGCQLGYSALGYSPVNRCKGHDNFYSWFGVAYPPHDQLADAAKAGIVKLTYPE